jgi:DNA-directed RNA polymerase specialized sigma subunit
MERIKKEGPEICVALFGTVDYVELSKEDDDFNSTEIDKTYGLCTPSPIEGIQIREIINSFYFTPKEKIIINMRMDGMKLEDIGAVLGISAVAVHKRIKEQIAPRLRFLIYE